MNYRHIIGIFLGCVGLFLLIAVFTNSHNVSASSCPAGLDGYNWDIQTCDEDDSHGLHLYNGETTYNSKSVFYDTFYDHMAYGAGPLYMTRHEMGLDTKVSGPSVSDNGAKKTITVSYSGAQGADTIYVTEYFTYGNFPSAHWIVNPSTQTNTYAFELSGYMDTDTASSSPNNAYYWNINADGAWGPVKNEMTIGFNASMSYHVKVKDAGTTAYITMNIDNNNNAEYRRATVFIGSNYHWNYEPVWQDQGKCPYRSDLAVRWEVEKSSVHSTWNTDVGIFPYNY
jgi:hypothetical protein